MPSSWPKKDVKKKKNSMKDPLSSHTTELHKSNNGQKQVP